MKLASIFQKHAVLQRDMTLPIWGLGEPGESVVVRLAGRDARTVVDGRGQWLLRLPPQPAGGPHTLIVEAPSGYVEMSDLLFGDVWLCSGQSNMEWKLKQSGPEWMGDVSELPQVRFLTLNTSARLGRTVSIEGNWKVCDAASLADFSAAGGFFGRELHRVLNVPVGLICNAWGGTRLQAWMSREALMQDSSGRDEIAFYESLLWQTRRATPTQTFEEWEKDLRELERTDTHQDLRNLGLERGWTTSNFDDSAWPTMPVPSHWQHHGHLHSGIFWFRRTEQVPETWVGCDLELFLGAIDKHDETWVNGELVGSMGWETTDAWCKPRAYLVPGRLIGHDRQVVIAVRVRSHIYDGGITGPSNLMCLRRAGDSLGSLPIDGDWRYEIECDWGTVALPEPDWGAGNHNSPHIMFDNRLTPLIPYGLRGAVWYQGESNVGEADLYMRMLPLMIRDWRRAWGQREFPFLQVQLANFGAPAKQPTKSQWAKLRETQLKVLAEPATGMAVAVDVGDAYNIHPQNKRTVGLRLAQWALSEIYGRDGIPSGPLFSGMKIEMGGRVRCSFRYVGTGLDSREGELRHFSVAGKDRIFHWAEAAIEGETVVVCSEDVPEPMAVRYAWADNPEGCNLYNKEGLPASPFRSDSWPD